MERNNRTNTGAQTQRETGGADIERKIVAWAGIMFAACGLLVAYGLYETRTMYQSFQKCSNEVFKGTSFSAVDYSVGSDFAHVIAQNGTIRKTYDLGNQGVYSEGVPAPQKVEQSVSDEEASILAGLTHCYTRNYGRSPGSLGLSSVMHRL